MRNYSILLVDDDPIITAGTGSDLEEKGYAVTTAESGEKAIELLNASFFDLVITDLGHDADQWNGSFEKIKGDTPGNHGYYSHGLRQYELCD